LRRVHIPKGSGAETRPIGIPTFEDKVLQRAVAMVPEAIYEQDFLDGSYGFRPTRSAHQALQTLWHETMRTAGGWVLEVDVRKFFDAMDHGHIREILRRRVLDGVLLRLIDKWLNAGVLEDGGITYPDAGSPQGGVVSSGANGRPGTFDMLGFTHYWGKSRTGKWLVKRSTSPAGAASTGTTTCARSSTLSRGGYGDTSGTTASPGTSRRSDDSCTRLTARGKSGSIAARNVRG
jgi:hypothetical protein